MKSNELSTEERIERRATWEAFEFRVCSNGIVNVNNTSHNEPGHTYSVDVVGSRVDNTCSCPNAKYQDGPCKHEIAVRNNTAVLHAGLAADGGQESCPNDEVGCPGPESDDLPCFECHLEANGVVPL